LLVLRLSALPAGLAGVVAAPVAARLLGKKRACLMVFVLAAFSTTLPIAARLLGLMPENGSTLLLAILIADTMATAVLGITGFIIVTSMLADIVEEIQVATGRRSEGLLFAAESLVRKLSGSFATLIPGIILAVVQFPSHANPGHVSPPVLTHLAVVYLPITAALMSCSILAVSFYRIDRRQHEANLEHLSEAEAMTQVAEPLGGP
jgi:Na+/melibiose symporter-like transporter